MKHLSENILFELIDGEIGLINEAKSNFPIDDIEQILKNLFECDNIKDIKIKNNIFYCTIEMMQEYDVDILIEYNLNNDIIKAQSNYINDIKTFRNFSGGFIDAYSYPAKITKDLEKWVDIVMNDWENSFGV